MTQDGGTDCPAIAEEELCHPDAPPQTAAVLCLISATLFFSAALTAAMVLLPVLALVLAWTYIVIAPFVLFALVCLFAKVPELDSARLPAMVCAALSPFITWYCRTAGGNTYFAVCLLVLCISLIWLFQSINLFMDNVFHRWIADLGHETLRYALRMSFKSVIYFIIIPLCADLVGIIYRSHDADWTLTYILDNLTATRPFPMVLLHYGGLIFAMFYESAIAFTMACTLARRRQ